MLWDINCIQFLYVLPRFIDDSIHTTRFIDDRDDNLNIKKKKCYIKLLYDYIGLVFDRAFLASNFNKHPRRGGKRRSFCSWHYICNLGMGFISLIQKLMGWVPYLIYYTVRHINPSQVSPVTPPNRINQACE